MIYAAPMRFGRMLIVACDPMLCPIHGVHDYPKKSKKNQKKIQVCNDISPPSWLPDEILLEIFEMVDARTQF